MGPTIPEPLQAEHQELHRELARATAAGGRTGEAAREVARLLHPHFAREEAFALPPLGLMARLARGEVPPPEAAAAAIAMAARLRAELPGMLAEHGRIVSALEALAAAADSEGHEEIVRFAGALRQHARTEEEVLYPATLLLGEHLRRAGSETPARPGA